jgi:hypothetical protein
VLHHVQPGKCRVYWFHFLTVAPANKNMLAKRIWQAHISNISENQRFTDWN